MYKYMSRYLSLNHDCDPTYLPNIFPNFYYLVVARLGRPDLLLGEVVRHLVPPVLLPDSPAVESHHQCSHHQDGPGDDDDQDQQESGVLWNRKCSVRLFTFLNLSNAKSIFSLLSFRKKCITYFIQCKEVSGEINI